MAPFLPAWGKLYPNISTSVSLMGYISDAIALGQNILLLILLLTLCGLTSQKTHWRGIGLGGLVHEEAHPCFLYIVQTHT